MKDPQALAKELDRKPLAIERKLERMGVVVSKWKFQKTLTTVPLTPNLLTREQALKILALFKYVIQAEMNIKIWVFRVTVVLSRFF